MKQTFDIAYAEWRERIYKELKKQSDQRGLDWDERVRLMKRIRRIEAEMARER